MGEPARRLATYEDVLLAPEGMTAELVDGELQLSRRPRSTHLSAAIWLGGDIDRRFGRRRGGDGPGGWWILPEPELHLGVPEPSSRVLVPDLAGWRRERMPQVPDVAAFTLPPDWVCEILSPGPQNARRDRMVKPDLYASAGVTWMWLVDPVGQLVEVFELLAGRYTRAVVVGGDDVARLAPFDAVELDVGAWWAPAADAG